MDLYGIKYNILPVTIVDSLVDIPLTLNSE